MTDKEQIERIRVIQGIRLIPADLHERQVASLRESNQVYREQCAKLAGQLDGAMRVGEGAALAVSALSGDVRDMETRIDELTAALQRIADLAQIGEKLPTGANFRNIRQHAERALGAKEGE